MKSKTLNPNTGEGKNASLIAAWKGTGVKRVCQGVVGGHHTKKTAGNVALEVSTPKTNQFYILLGVLNSLTVQTPGAGYASWNAAAPQQLLRVLVPPFVVFVLVSSSS